MRGWGRGKEGRDRIRSRDKHTVPPILNPYDITHKQGYLPYLMMPWDSSSVSGRDTWGEGDREKGAGRGQVRGGGNRREEGRLAG